MQLLSKKPHNKTKTKSRKKVAMIRPRLDVASWLVKLSGISQSKMTED